MRKKSGLTLIELVMVLGLTPIVLGLIYKVVTSSYKMINLEMKRANVYEQAKTYVSSITHNLKNSRVYLDTTDLNATTLKDAAPTGSKPILYIEGYDDKRYMYVLEPASGGKYDLKLYHFQDDVVQNKYKPVEVSGNYDEEYLDPDVFTKLNGDLQNKIIVTADNIGVTLKTEYTAQFIYYDSFDSQSYLIADKASTHYKIQLEKITDYSTIVANKSTIMQYVEDAKVETNALNDKLCSIMVKAIDDGKVKEISTNVYVFVQS
jgi:hypothetical protein